MNNSKIKLYSVKFLQYTDVLERSASDSDGFHLDLANVHYIDTDNLVIKESDLPYYQKFGGGLKSIQFVGYLGVPEDTHDRNHDDNIDPTFVGDQ